LSWYLGDHVVPYSSAAAKPADPKLLARLFPRAAA
jgi:hypothetical protein